MILLRKHIVLRDILLTTCFNVVCVALNKHICKPPPLNNCGISYACSTVFTSEPAITLLYAQHVCRNNNLLPSCVHLLTVMGGGLLCNAYRGLLPHKHKQDVENPFSTSGKREYYNNDHNLDVNVLVCGELTFFT